LLTPKKNMEQYDETFFDRKNLDELNKFMDKYNAHVEYLPVMADEESIDDYDKRYRDFLVQQLKKKYLIKKKK
jgi:hypothetical protein